MYKVVINKVNYNRISLQDVNFVGEGSTKEIAQKRAEEKMRKEYPGDIFCFNYNAYKIIVPAYGKSYGNLYEKYLSNILFITEEGSRKRSRWKNQNK